MDKVIQIDFDSFLNEHVHVVIEAHNEHRLHDLHVKYHLVSNKGHVVESIGVESLQDKDNWHSYHRIDKVPQEVVAEILQKDSNFELSLVTRLQNQVFQVFLCALLSFYIPVSFLYVWLLLCVYGSFLLFITVFHKCIVLLLSFFFLLLNFSQ